MMSKRQRWFGIFLAKAILVCGCASFALYGQSTPTATWTGEGGDSNWGNGKNWSWDNGSQCDDPISGIAIPPGNFINPSSPCYIANVMIGKGVTVNENANGNASSGIYNFTLGASTLNGPAGGTGNVTIGSGAIVNGDAGSGLSGSVTIARGATVIGSASASSSSGVVTNQGTIMGSAAGATVINTQGGVIHASGLYAQVFAPTQGTNAGLIEATGAGGTGSVSLTGPWNNTGGTIQIDGGTVLVCDATITNGSLINNGGSIGGAGNGLTIAGTVYSTTPTIDNGSNVTVNGTLNVNGTLTLGQSTGMSTMTVSAGGVLNVSTSGQTILGMNAGATGQLEFLGASPQHSATGINLNIGMAGTGYVSVASGATVDVGNLYIANGPGSGNLDVQGGVVNYGQLQAFTAGMYFGPAISVNQGGTLMRTGPPSISGDSIFKSSVEVTGVGSQWIENAGIEVTLSTLTISLGGTLTELPRLRAKS
jgi:hypothetical protein